MAGWGQLAPRPKDLDHAADEVSPCLPPVPSLCLHRALQPLLEGLDAAVRCRGCDSCRAYAFGATACRNQAQPQSNHVASHHGPGRMGLAAGSRRARSPRARRRRRRRRRRRAKARRTGRGQARQRNSSSEKRFHETSARTACAALRAIVSRWPASRRRDASPFLSCAIRTHVHAQANL